MAYKIQEIFLSVQRRRLPGQRFTYSIEKAFESICSCRTSDMGGFIQSCGDCGHTEPRFHSCKNRHCPICQGSKQEQWVQKQASNTLPIPYFHVVFTLPSELNPLVLANPSQLYNLLFQAASKTILTLSQDKKFLGAQAGFTTILHTWGSNLQFHPHLHCIVAGGGLSIDKKSFVLSRESFFLPVHVMSRLFKGKFMSGLKELINSGSLRIPESVLCFPDDLYTLTDKLYTLDWVVYCKKPFKDSSHVLRYLGRYTHRVAISNNRIVSFDQSSRKVCFKWKDYRCGNTVKEMTLSDEEFVRRFLLHILPDGFVKIRHYGFLANNHRDDHLDLCLKLLKRKKPNLTIPTKNKEIPILKTCCPSCGNPSFCVIFSSPRYCRSFMPTGTEP